MIAMSIANNPDLLIADEPTTALDVTVQLQILELLKKIQEKRKMSILFISHDLGVVNKIADYVYVMKDGRIIEHGNKKEIFETPKDNYTKELVGFKNLVKKSNYNKKLEIVLSDKGMGMSNKVKSKIFDKFYRIPQGNIHNVKGHGLGLSFVKKIIDLHNGTISVSSELGKGSEFKIIFKI